MKILFSFDTIPINDINKTKQISNVDTTLWHERLGHFNNKDIINFVIEHTYNLIIKIIKECDIMIKKPLYEVFSFPIMSV